MSIIYTYSDARQNFSAVLNQALREGQVKVRRKDGQVFVITPEQRSNSPFAVEGVALGISSAEIVEFVRESRRAYETDPPV
jgi:hypothetical protein